MTPQEAIARAAGVRSRLTVEKTDPNDPQGLGAGTGPSSCRPTLMAENSRLPANVKAVDRDTIVVQRHEPDVGNICVHFPRAGYRVERA